MERLTRRLRSVSQRMEGIEEAVDRLDQRLAGLAVNDQLSALEGRLASLTIEVSNLASALDAGPTPPPREQERLKVDEPAPTPARRRTAKKKA
jgi:hypothetical protein